MTMCTFLQAATAFSNGERDYAAVLSEKVCVWLMNLCIPVEKNLTRKLVYLRFEHVGSDCAVKTTCSFNFHLL